MRASVLRTSGVGFSLMPQVFSIGDWFAKWLMTVYAFREGNVRGLPQASRG